ncbi:MAG: YceI family protein [Woeseiaceae bacterium]|nr:YceI family protein [Woeseiaceae bacterium]
MTRLPLICLLVALSTPAAADWVLDNDASRLSFVTTKANVAAEVHRFRSLEGNVDERGNATVAIDLNSVDTSIEIRDERMREMLFETEKYPTATLAATIDMNEIKALEPGSKTNILTEAQLQIHGTTVSLTVDLSVARLSETRVLVASDAPVIVNAGQSGLAAGVERLREVAGLPSISPAVPVTFVLAFDDR